MRTAGTFVFFAAVAGANIFLILYTVLARWWRNPMGRHLFSFMLVMALALNYIVVQLVWPEAPYRMHVRFFLYLALASVIWWRIIILINVQLRGKRGALAAYHSEEGTRGGHTHVDHASRSDIDLVAGQHPVVSGDERMGKRSRPLRWIPRSTSGGVEWERPVIERKPD